MGFFSEIPKRRKRSTTTVTAPPSHPPAYSSPAVPYVQTTGPAPPRVPNHSHPTNGPPMTIYTNASANIPYQPVPQLSQPAKRLNHALKWASTTQLPTTISCPIINKTQDYIEKGIDVYDKVGDRLGDIICRIDEGENWNSNEAESIFNPPLSPPPAYSVPAVGNGTDRSIVKQGRTIQPKKSIPQTRSIVSLSKVSLYANSKLPPQLQTLHVYMPTWPLFCLAAKYSTDAYLQPESSKERKDFVSADGRLGTKAMVIKSLPVDDKKTIVFAIRGTSMLSLRDWGVNLETNLVPPVGFLDDNGNYCHAGFLRVAKAMIVPIAERLRQLLEENPNRSACSLLITGHSAGGAVASLLYAHMLSETFRSDLNILTGCFKRVHCVTFGAPPVTLLPLQKPGGNEGKWRKCLFHSFINEGDPVVRAERAYVRSLIELISSPPPSSTSPFSASKLASPQTLASQCSSLAAIGASMSRLDLSIVSPPKEKKSKYSPHSQGNSHLSAQPQAPIWQVPPATLSNAGRIVALRIPTPSRGHRVKEENVIACIISDEQLRQVIFGDPAVHTMQLYRQRIETLAVKAVTGRQ